MVSIYQFAGRRNSGTSDIVGLSTDTKPIKEYNGTPILNGSAFLEMDTGKISLYDEENKKWYTL